MMTPVPVARCPRCGDSSILSGASTPPGWCLACSMGWHPERVLLPGHLDDPILNDLLASDAEWLADEPDDRRAEFYAAMTGSAGYARARLTAEIRDLGHEIETQVRLLPWPRRLVARLTARLTRAR